MNNRRVPPSHRLSSVKTFLPNDFLDRWMVVSPQLKPSLEVTNQHWTWYGHHYRVVLPKQYLEIPLRLSPAFISSNVLFTPWQVAEAEGLLNAVIHSMPGDVLAEYHYLVVDPRSTVELVRKEVVRDAAEYFENSGKGVYRTSGLIVLDVEKESAWATLETEEHV